MRLTVLLVALTLVAGYVDAVAFFGLGVFTANMTGNTVLLGGAIAARFVPAFPGDAGLVLPALSLALFIAGALIAARVLRGETGRPPARSIGILAVVAVLLAASTVWQMRGADPRVEVALLSAVMGLQSVLATKAGVGGVSTTFVTGTLVRAVLDFTGSPETAVARAEGRTNLAVWVSYLAGATGGAFALHALGGAALWIPAVVVALLLAVV